MLANDIVNRPMASHSNYIHDRPATEDTLGRSHFAEALSHSLVLPKGSPGLVVGIEGNWGSGKSTLIGFITKNLGEITGGNVPIVVEFNPWMVSNSGALVEALIGQIAASIGKDLSSGEKGVEVSQKLIGYVGLLKHLKFLKYIPALEWAGNLVVDISDVAQTVATTSEQGAEAGQKAIDDFKKLLPTLDMPQRKNEVVVALDALDRPIVVVIDDLDRLPVEEIRAMIQAIKAVADFPRITYLLAYDRSIVACALAADEESGFSYLEKIVQVAYPIPPLSQRQLKKFANDKVRSLLDQLHIELRKYEQDRYEEALALLAKLARHPRDIVRVVNRLTLSLPATHGEVNASDVIVFEALAQRFPALREAILNYSIDFTGGFFRGDLIEGDDAFEWGFLFAQDKDRDKDKGRHPWLKHLPKNERDQRIAEKACLFLFPRLEKGDGRINYEDSLRIADPDRLGRLFMMTSIEDVPEAKTVHAWLMDPKKLEDALSLDEGEQLLFLLDWMINYTPSCPTPNVKGCIEKLTEVSHELASQCRLDDEIADKLSQVMTHLLRLKTHECNECFLSIAKNTPLSISEYIVTRAAVDQGKWKPRPSDRADKDNQLISDSDLVDQAIRIWTERVRECDAQGDLYKEANLHSILHRYAQLNDNYEGAYLAISNMCKTDKGLVAFLEEFREKGVSNQFTLVEDAKNLVQRITKSTLKDEYKWIVDMLSSEEAIKFVSEQSARLKKEIPLS